MAGPDQVSRLPQRALGSLFLAGATIGLLSLLLPHSPRADVPGLYSNVALAFAAGIALWLMGARVPRWTLHLAIAAGTLLIARAVLLSGDRASFYSVWFIWVGLYAFYFFTRAAATVHVGFVAMVYALTLAHTGATSPFARWLTTVTTLVVAGMLIETLLRRARHEASAAAANATRMGTVAEVAHELAAVSDTAAARPALCAAAAKVTRAAGVGLWEPTQDGSALQLTASFGWTPGQRVIAFAGPPAGAPQAFTTGKVSSDVGALTGDQPSACLWQPILRDHASIAVLAAYWKSADALEDPAVLALVDLLASEAAVTLERVGLLARLEAVARTDELTGLPNRRAWHEELPRELARSRRASEPLCVAMLDLDHFKEYNDERGHQAGDRLLKEVAGAWTSELRATDVLARYGGEEFALALPGCSIEDAFAVVERLRAAIPGGESCSAGIALWNGHETSAELLERADTALYDAKRGGRDRTFVARSVKLG
jgi:diguanylate cyclase (GGDEF)-like protein